MKDDERAAVRAHVGRILTNNLTDEQMLAFVVYADDPKVSSLRAVNIKDLADKLVEQRNRTASPLRPRDAETEKMSG